MEEVLPFRAVNRIYPQFINVPLHHTHGELPTHVLAVMGGNKPAAKMYAIHAEVYAVQCEHIPFPERALTLPHAIPYLKNTGRFEISLPLITFEIPHVESFELIHNFLYDHDRSKLLKGLLPVPIIPDAKIGEIKEAAAAYAQLKDAKNLHLNAQHIYNVWNNMCTIGADFEDFWRGIDIAWGVVIEAMKILKSHTPGNR